MVDTMSIADIRIGNRFRSDLGDVDSLAASIAKLGLINPITVDSSGLLLAGFRRYTAVRALGWVSIPVNRIDTLSEAVTVLEIEAEENTERKAMTTVELSNWASALAAVRRREARGRQGERTDLQLPAGTGGKSSTSANRQGEVKNQVAKLIGTGSTNAADLILIGDAAASGDAAVRAAGEVAQLALADGGSVEKAATELRRAIGRTRSVDTRPKPSNNPRKTDMIRAVDQASAIGGQANYCHGMVDNLAFLQERMRDGLSPEIEKTEVDRWVVDFRAARTALARMIKFLERDST